MHDGSVNGLEVAAIFLGAKYREAKDAVMLGTRMAERAPRRLDVTS